MTALYRAHVDAGARMVEFAGYSMPVQYKGVIAEALAVRNGAGMFDVSHMARLTFTGERVLEYLEWVTTNDVADLEIGLGQYSMLPNANGGVVDDIIVYRTGESEFKMVVNASNHAKDRAHLDKENTFGVEIVDSTSETAMIAVQGPTAVEIVAGLSDAGETLKGLGLFGTATCQIGDVTCFCARSGYTGEDGFELVCSAVDAVKLWDALVSAGVEPCGLGSRDTLRVEAGLPLYGHELEEDLSPIAAGLGWVISKKKSFIGSDLINQARKDGTPTKLQGFKLEGKRLPMAGMEVSVDGKVAGKVSSGVYSVIYECGLGFAFLDPQVKLGDSCTLDMRGKSEPGVVSTKRFLKDWKTSTGRS